MSSLILPLIKNLKIIKKKEKFFQLLKNSEYKIKTIIFLNANTLNQCFKNKKLKNIIKNNKYLLRDGLGVKIACQFNGIDPGLNMNGTDLIPEILKKLKSYKIAFIGGKREIITKHRKTLIKKYKPVLITNGYKKFGSYLREINKKKPNILILGMGTPKQEFFSNYLEKKLKSKMLIINGGAIINFITGEEKRANKYFRKLGMEWLFRLYNDPVRLFKRYIFGNPLLISRIINEKYFK